VHTAYTPEQARTYDSSRFVSPAGRAIHDIELGLLKQAIARVSREARVLEVGCGTGRLLLPLLEAGYVVDGTDASEAMLAACRSKLGDRFPKVELRLAEAAALPYQREAYAFVYAIRVLNQTGSHTYALKALSEMLRVTQPGGYLLAEFVNANRPTVRGLHDGGVRLKTSAVIAHLEGQGATVLELRGAFFLGMTSFLRAPVCVLSPLGSIERLGSALVPRLCSRCYVLAQRRCG
jgi:SAM-dependent methyltransferase